MDMTSDSFACCDDGWFRCTFEDAPGAIVVLDDHRNSVLLNRVARELRGVDVAKMFTLRSEGELAPFFERLRLRGRSSHNLTVTGADGCVRHFVLEGSGVNWGAIVTIRDVTEHRDLEREVRQLRRLEAIGFLTASVTHDFNNLLMVIGSASAQLANTVQDRPAELELALEIKEAAERATTLVRQLLPRLTSQHAPPEAVNLGAVLTGVRPLLQRLAGDKVEISLLLDHALGETVVDREALEHVVFNLVANARDAMPQGGRVAIGTCNVSLGDDGLVSEAFATGRNYVALSVSDTGVGMSSAIRDRIFEPFFTTKDPAQGTGMGLAMVRQFALQSGGCVFAHSTPGQGTTIVLYLPRAKASSRGNGGCDPRTADS